MLYILDIINSTEIPTLRIYLYYSITKLRKLKQPILFIQTEGALNLIDLKINNYTHVMSSYGTLSNMQFSQFYK